ncbi:MAG: menaquinone biosynthesis decarboxylase [Phycisphaerae bacterium]
MSFPYNDLREFLSAIESGAMLKRIKTTVDPELEITAIVDRVVKQSGPALLFENVKHSSMPVAINLFGSDQRMKLALGVKEYTEITSRIEELIQPDIPVGLMAKLKKIPQLMQIAGFPPREVRSGPCQEIVCKDKFSLNDLPILKCWPDDGGKYITLGLTIARHPVTGQRNTGIYRLQVYDDRHTGMHIHPFHDGAVILREYARQGQKMPVAIVIGTDPVITYAASSPLPAAIDEMMFAGFLRSQPVEMVKCQTVDLEVPATAEIVLEGFVDPNQLRIEGPFGDHTGFYSPAQEFPIFEITCITHRRDPIYQTMIVGLPPMEDTFLGWATERIFLPLIKVMQPEIVDYHLPAFGVFHNWLVVSIDKTYPHQARKVICALWGLGQMMLSKFIVIVDADVNIHNLEDVMFHIAANVDPRRDTFTVEGPLDILDHASPECGAGSKMGIDATRKLPTEGHHRPWPEKLKMPDDIIKLINTKWQDYGLE